MEFGMAYEWVKALHIISVIAWMAGMLYLPRLYVYHAMVEAGSVRAETFKLMERRLLKVIMNPALIASWGFGLAMVYMYPALLSEIWMLIKIGCVCVMTVTHMIFGKMRKELEKDQARADRAYRIWNEVPTILMIIIVIMAVVEPI
jgi:putative membrane protein